MENSIKWTEKPQNTNLVTTIGASVMMFILVWATLVIPGVFLFVFMNNTFMTFYYICENLMVFMQKIDQGAKVINESLKDGQFADKSIDWAKPIVVSCANQLVDLSREVKPPVDINDLSTEEEKYEKYKFSVETAVGQGNVGRLKSLYRNKEVMKYADLAELVNSALPEEAEEAPKAAKPRSERKYF
jgi:hypothetical protein